MSCWRYDPLTCSSTQQFNRWRAILPPPGVCRLRAGVLYYTHIHVVSVTGEGVVDNCCLFLIPGGLFTFQNYCSDFCAVPPHALVLQLARDKLTALGQC